jgi:hypothetical protein
MLEVAAFFFGWSLSGVAQMSARALALILLLSWRPVFRGDDASMASLKSRP